MNRSWLLAGGMLVGATLAVLYIVRIPDDADPTGDAVAWVNDRAISRASYESALQAVAGDRKDGTLREDDRRRVLDRLIDQELLIDRAVELGLHERDPQIRNQLATAMIDFLVRRAEDEAAGADDGALSAFYEQNQFRFQRSAQYRIQIEGASVPLPGGFLLSKEIEQRLGPSATKTITALAAGESAVIDEGDAGYTAHLLERRDGGVATFNEARDAIEAAYLRDRTEVAVRDYLELARKRSDVRVESEP